MKSFVGIVVASLAITCVLAAPTSDPSSMNLTASFEFGKNTIDTTSPLKFDLSFGPNATEKTQFTVDYTNGTNIPSETPAILNDHNYKEANLTLKSDATDIVNVTVYSITVDNGNKTFKFCNQNKTCAVVTPNAPFRFEACNSASSLFLGLGSVLVVILSMFSH